MEVDDNSNSENEYISSEEDEIESEDEFENENDEQNNHEEENTNELEDSEEEIAVNKKSPGKSIKIQIADSTENEQDVFAHVRRIAASKLEHDQRLNAAYVAITQLLVSLLVDFVYSIEININQFLLSS